MSQGGQDRHRSELERNRQVWRDKALLREIYAEFYGEMARRLRRDLPGKILEIGAGFGASKAYAPPAIRSDLVANPGVDLVLDGYHIPFRDGSISNLMMLDVFHHLERPAAFLREAWRVTAPGGRLVILEPFISWVSWLVYGLFHAEPVAWRRPINLAEDPPPARRYYAAQGNATRLFFRQSRQAELRGWTALERRAWASFAYLASGGFSRPAFYPARFRKRIAAVDHWLSCCPGCCGARCLIVLERNHQIFARSSGDRHIGSEGPMPNAS